jgi:hypothetical protein
MRIIAPSLSPGKGRWPTSEVMRARRRYLLRAAGEYGKALTKRRYGTLGAASAVRHIDPASIDVGRYLK